MKKTLMGMEVLFFNNNALLKECSRKGLSVVATFWLN